MRILLMNLFVLETDTQRPADSRRSHVGLTAYRWISLDNSLEAIQIEYDPEKAACAASCEAGQRLCFCPQVSYDALLDAFLKGHFTVEGSLDGMILVSCDVVRQSLWIALQATSLCVPKLSDLH